MTQKRKLGEKLLESIRAIKRGEGKSYSVEVPSDVT